MTRPLKSLLPAYRDIEKDIERVIFERFGLGDLPYAPDVKRADLRMLAAEQKALMPGHADSWAVLSGIDPAPIRNLRWGPDWREAESLWLNRFSKLINVWPVADLEEIQ